MPPTSPFSTMGPRDETMWDIPQTLILRFQDTAKVVNFLGTWEAQPAGVEPMPAGLQVSSTAGRRTPVWRPRV